MGTYKFSTTLNSVVGSMTDVSTYLTYAYARRTDPAGRVPEYPIRTVAISTLNAAQGSLVSAWVFEAMYIPDFNSLCTAIGLTQAAPSKRISVYTLLTAGETPTYQTANATITRPAIEGDNAQRDVAKDARYYFHVIFPLFRVEFY